MTNFDKNVDPKALYGEDLTSVFGPKANRKAIRDLDQKERRKILARIPEYVDTGCLGEDPSLYDIANLCLLKLEQCGALKGIDLDWYDDKKFQEATLERPLSMYKLVEKICKNGKTQRGIQLRHLVGDILFNFDPECVLMGLARYSANEDRYYLNDAQHRYVACVILGIRAIPLEYKTSELRSDDISQYAAVNILSLSASEYDKYRIKVAAIEARLQEQPETCLEKAFSSDYIQAHEVWNILRSENCMLIEKGSDDKTKASQCTGVRNLLRHYADYGSEIFTRALKINQRSMYNAPISTPNIWGICEFIKYQENYELDISAEDMDAAIIEAIRYRYYPNRNGLHMDAKRCFTRGAAKDFSIPEQSKIAAGILKILKETSPEIGWSDIKFAGESLLKFMEDFKVPTNAYNLVAMMNR